MANYKYSKKKGLDKDEINKYKDFGKLIGPVEKAKKRLHQPLYRDPKFFIGLLVLLLIVYLVWSQVEKEKQEETKPKQELLR
jgi:hypothetical protein